MLDVRCYHLVYRKCMCDGRCERYRISESANQLQLQQFDSPIVHHRTTKHHPSGTGRHHCSQNPKSEPRHQLWKSSIVTWDAKSHSPPSQCSPSEAPDSHVRVSGDADQSHRAQHLISKTSCRCFTAPVSSPALANHSAVEIEGLLRRLTSRFGQLLGVGWGLESSESLGGAVVYRG